MYECKTRDYPVPDANEKGIVGHWFSRRLFSLEVEVRMPITLISVEGTWERGNTGRITLPIGLQIITITPKLREQKKSPFALGTLSD